MTTEDELEAVGVKPLHAKIILKKAHELVQPATHTVNAATKKHWSLKTHRVYKIIFILGLSHMLNALATKTN